MRELVPALQLAHALFMGGLFLLFAYQGALGWKLRRRRLAGGAPDFAAVRRHRKLGPLLTLLASAGYLSGLVTAFLDRGTLLAWPLHLAVGSALLAALAATFLASKKIRGPVTPWRTLHFALGATSLLIFFSQALLGLAILL